MPSILIRYKTNTNLIGDNYLLIDYVLNTYNIDIKNDEDSKILHNILIQSISLIDWYNKIIIIKYFYNKIDFYVINNKIFENYIIFFKYTNLERELYILNIAENILSNLFNSYKSNLFYLTNNCNCDIYISIKSINMNLNINNDFVIEYLKTLKKPIDDYNIREASQDISHNIIMSVLHRLLFINIVNKLCKDVDLELKSKLFFTKGNVILVNIQYLTILKKLLLHNKFPKAIYKYINVFKNESLYDFINNNNYSYPI